MIFLIGYVLLRHGSLFWTYVLLPVVFGLQFLWMIGLAFGLSALGVYFRDVKDVVMLYVTASLYILPIIYLPNALPAVVKGIIPVTLLAEQKLVVVTDNLQAAKGKKFKVGPATFNIESVGTTGNKQHEIKITYTEDSGENNYDWSRLQAIQQRVELQDASGKKIPSNARITNYMGPTSVQFSIVTNASGGNAKNGITVQRTVGTAKVARLGVWSSSSLGVH